MKRGGTQAPGKVVSINVSAPIVTHFVPERPLQQNHRQAYLKCCAVWRKPADNIAIAIHRARLEESQRKDARV